MNNLKLTFLKMFQIKIKIAYIKWFRFYAQDSMIP